MPFEKQLQQMLANEDFSRLDAFEDESSWSSMTSSERDLLAMLFIIQGQQQLKQGDSKVFESFDIATRIAPQNPVIHFRIGMFLAMHTKNMRCQMLAAENLEKAISLDPHFFEGWSSLGCVLVNMGVNQSEPNYFHDAHQKFESAEKLLSKVSLPKQAELYWQWGNCWSFLGKMSGEAHDFHIALSKYRQASEMSPQYADFWQQYGNALAEMAILMGKNEMFLEAAELFRNAIKITDDSFHAWLGLACCYQRLFEFFRDNVYFDLANESFAKASEIESDSVDLWLNWGVLLAESGKIRNEIEHFYLSFEKFARANAAEENHALVFSRWGEAQMFCGAYTEKAELLRDAEAKIVKSLEIHSDNADTWYIYGSCLNELGRYFSDVEFYKQAIEKFNYGLTLNHSHAWLWHGLALAHFAAGELLEDLNYIEKATRFCAKVLEFSGQQSPQFWNDWGVALMKLAEMTEEKSYVISSIDKFERAIGKYEDEKYACDIEWLYNYGCALDLLGSFTEDAESFEKAVHFLTIAVTQDPTYNDARYNLALALSHLGEWTDDLDHLIKAHEHFQILLSEDNEIESAWHDWGVTCVHIALLMTDPAHIEMGHKYFTQAEEKLTHAIALGSTGAFYSIACLYSLTGNFALAMHFIEKADQSQALPSIDDIMNDEWLDGLRRTPEFREFISLLNKDS